MQALWETCLTFKATEQGGVGPEVRVFSYTTGGYRRNVGHGPVGPPARNDVVRLNGIRLVWPLGAALLVVLSACAGNKGPTKGRAVKPEVTRDVPSALRGTIGSEASLTKRAKPILVSGFGLVVGLPGTGGGELPQRVAGTMERQLGLMQMNKASDALVGTIFEGKTPGQMLRMKEVAVVIVYAQVVPGAPDATNFDVYVTSVNKGPDISLEGGVLWTTDLHPGPPSPTGAVTAKPIARAKGPIFINPFSDPSAKEGFSGQNGRVLGGGTVVNSLDLELVLDNESHSRATSMVGAINARFPQAGEPVARGKTARIIHVTVPPSYRDDAETFLQTLMHVQVQQGPAPEFAKRYVEALKSQPALSDELSWCLQALPQKAAVHFVRELYDSTETGIKMAGLRAGAGLGDALAAPALKQLAKEGPPTLRAEAVRLLGKLSAGPTVDVALKEQLNSKELSVRVAAYESLVARAEAIQLRRLRDMRQPLPPGVRLARREENAAPPAPAILELGAESLQGVKRRVIEGKFVLDVVPSGEPLVYVTQRGRPRIVVFGEKMELVKPCVVSAWNDRLMLASDSSTDDCRVYYKTLDRIDDAGDTWAGVAVSGKAPSDVASLVEFMAHVPSVEDPRPGLGLTYSEVVGALYAFQQGRAIGASFAVEEDLEQAKLLAQSRETAAPDRPDTKKDAATIKVFEPAVEPVPGPPAPKEPEPMVVPLPQPKVGN